MPGDTEVAPWPPASQTAQDGIVTKEEAREMRENLARTNFGMSLDESVKARKAGEFDGDRERHNRVIGLAMMRPEYWED